MNYLFMLIAEGGILLPISLQNPSNITVRHLKQRASSIRHHLHLFLRYDSPECSTPIIFQFSPLLPRYRGLRYQIRKVLPQLGEYFGNHE